jgi:hypothetical protein
LTGEKCLSGTDITPLSAEVSEGDVVRQVLALSWWSFLNWQLLKPGIAETHDDFLFLFPSVCQQLYRSLLLLV